MRAARRALVLLALALAASAQAQIAVPALTGRVVDTADLLRPATREALEAELAAHEAATSNQVVVLTVPSLAGETVEGAAHRVFQAWRLGQAGRDNGVLVLIARDERQLRIEVGRGLEGDLTDAQAGRIIRHEIVPHFRNEDYNAGTLGGVSAILGTIEGTYAPAEDAGEEMPWPVRILFTLTHIVLPMLIGAWALFAPGCHRYFLFVFGLIFIVAGGSAVIGPFGALVGLLFALAFLGADLYMARSPKWRQMRRRIAANAKAGKSTRVTLGGVSFSVGGSSSSSSGGGFSGGGGSSGGGGASGSW